MLDIFNNDAFSVARLTTVIEDMPHIPSRLRSLGLFAVDRVDTTTIMVEKKGGVLMLVPPTPRGGPGNTMTDSKAELRPLPIPHFEINGAVYAEEVQNVRAFGTENGLVTVAAKVGQRLRDHGNSHDATEEYARMGAVTGIVTYAGGSSLNLFTEFGVTQLAEVDFDLDNATPAAGALRKTCAGVIRSVTNELGGIGAGGFRAFCGDNFFDDLLQHPEVRATYDGWSEAKILRESYLGPDRMETYGIFEFGGIVWENYRGNVGGKAFVNTDKCHIFPMGVPGLFRTAYAPADYVETVNTLGRQRYARQYPMQNGKGVHLDSQFNALQYCTRPRVLVKGKRT